MSSDPWRDAFPLDEASRAVTLLTETWNELARRRLPKFSPTQSEPKLTEALTIHLRSISAEIGKLTGHWGYEMQGGKLSLTTGEVTSKYRTDIEYFSNKNEPTLKLVFEFKKIKGTQFGSYQKSGISRFIDGIYCPNEPVALMAGILLADKSKSVTNLKNALSNHKIAKTLRIIKCGDDGYIQTPSAVFSEADFDTRHERFDGAVKLKDLVLAHLFLTFPEDVLDDKDIEK